MSDIDDFDDFDVDHNTSMAWEAFTTRLDEILAVMDTTGDLTISVAASGATMHVPPAIRFSVTRPGVVEATLFGPHDDALVDLGWHSAPDGTQRVERDQEQSLELAAIITETLSRVLGVIHPVFLEPDQLAELLSGVPESDVKTVLAAGPQRVYMPTNRLELDAAVDAELTERFGHPPLRTEDGDVALRVGSTMLFLRSTPDFQELVLFAVLVHEVDGRSRACEVLNDLNTEARYCRFALHRDRVFVQMSVFAQPFVPSHLMQALEALSKVSDGIDDELANRLSGRTTFPG